MPLLKKKFLTTNILFQTKVVQKMKWKSMMTTSQMY